MVEPLCDGKGNQIIHGIKEELIKRSVKYVFDNLLRKWGGMECGESYSGMCTDRRGCWVNGGQCYIEE